MRKIILSILVTLFVTSLSAQSYKIIVNNANTTSALSKKEITEYFLKKKTKWADGNKVVPIDLKNNAVRDGFSKEVLEKSTGAVKSYWQQYVFSGKGTPPVEKASDADIVLYIKSNLGAIGYVAAGADISGVKVISITN